MTRAELVAVLVGALQGIAVAAGVLLAAFVALSLLFDARKLRRRGRHGARSLDELVGQAERARMLPPDTPRGPVDQLRTPELLEASARRSG
jgi:acid phosphatase family membrane protein YuiD